MKETKETKDLNLKIAIFAQYKKVSILEGSSSTLELSKERKILNTLTDQLDEEKRNIFNIVLNK
tara:strand:- start:105 stop:296 length:192 start_codon:yes stop_codon:yes gene_type:complete